MTGCRFEVNPILEVHADIVIAELERDSKCASRRERTIRIERVPKAVRLSTFLELGRLVRTDCDDRKAQLRQLGFDLAQLTELRIAIGSPAAAVEDEQLTGLAGEF